jgi:hypothetical protein
MTSRGDLCRYFPLFDSGMLEVCICLGLKGSQSL